MNLSFWVQNTGSQALQKLSRVGAKMDKLSGPVGGLSTPSHLPQQQLIQKLEVSPAQVRDPYVTVVWPRLSIAAPPLDA